MRAADHGAVIRLLGSAIGELCVHAAVGGEPERSAGVQLFELLAKIGGPDLIGPVNAVPAGTFWPVTW